MYTCDVYGLEDRCFQAYRQRYMVYHAVDLGDVPLWHWFYSVGLTESKRKSPCDYAMTYYLGQHILGRVRERYLPFEPLPDKLVAFLEAYSKWLEVEAIPRAVAYLLIACTRETRHGSANSKLQTWANPDIFQFWLHLVAKQTSICVQRILCREAYIMTGGDSYKHVYEKPVSEYVEHLCQFLTPNDTGLLFPAGAYGGPKWHNNATTLESYIEGDISGEVFLDCVWNLVHNGGPIFDKDVLFKDYHGEPSFSGYSNCALVDVLKWQKKGSLYAHFANQVTKTSSAWNGAMPLARKMIGPVVSLFPDEGMPESALTNTNKFLLGSKSSSKVPSPSGAEVYDTVLEKLKVYNERSKSCS